MFKKNLLSILPVILLFTCFVKADVAPDPGYIRVRPDLIVETREDVSDYRFFLDFYEDLKEIDIISKGRTNVPAMGGGARYSSGRFFAIPRKNLTGFEGELSDERLSELGQAIKNKKIEGVVELARHSFSQDIVIFRKLTFKAPVYQLVREGNSLKAVISDDGENPASGSLVSKYTLIIGGTFLTLAVLVIGLLVFRKVSKKTKINV